MNKNMSGMYFMMFCCIGSSPGASGVNGGVIVNTNIGPTAPVVLADGTANLIVTNIGISQALATQIMNNPAGFYFNMHTPLNPGGAIRGQLSRLQ